MTQSNAFGRVVSELTAQMRTIEGQLASLQEAAESDLSIQREFYALICEEQGREWESDDQISEKNYAAFCADLIRSNGNDPAIKGAVITLMERLCLQSNRIEELERRLEIDSNHDYDGIAARDETIRQLEARLDAYEKQKPVAWILPVVTGGGVFIGNLLSDDERKFSKFSAVEPLYRRPPIQGSLNAVIDPGVSKQ